MTASEMEAPLRGSMPDSSPPASPSGNSYSPSRDHYTVNCNLAEHKLLKPEQLDSPPSRSRLYNCLAVAAAVAVVVAVVGFSIGGTAGSGGAPAAITATQPTAQQSVNPTATAAAVPAQTSPLQAGSADSNSSSAGENPGDQETANSGSREPMAPADLNHVAAPLQNTADEAIQQVDCSTPASSQNELCREVQQRRAECAKAHDGLCAECSQDADRFDWCTAPSDADRFTVVDGWPVPKAGFQPSANPAGVEPCPPGTAKGTAGTQLCVRCTGRTFQSLAGQTACAACPEGATVSADHTRCTHPRKAMPGSSQVRTTSVRGGGAEQSADATDNSTGEAGQPLVARPQLAHLPAAEADALASLDETAPAAGAAAQHHDTQAAAVDSQPAAETVASRHYDKGGRGP